MIPITAVWSWLAQTESSPDFTQILAVFWLCYQLYPHVFHFVRHYCTMSLEIDSNDPTFEKLVHYISDTSLIENWRTLQMEKDKASTEKEYRISPGFGSTRIWKSGIWIQRVERSGEDHRQRIIIFCLGSSKKRIINLIERARAYHQGSHAGTIEIYIAEKGTFIEQYSSSWIWGDPIYRSKRALETVFLPPGVKEDLIADFGRFLLPATKERYRIQGIQYRRGYLLYGCPRTGKTTLAIALASRYCKSLRTINLADRSLDDGLLGKAMSALPWGSILLLEDVDAIGRSRMTKKKGDDEDETDNKGVSLSGLLNALDGMYSPEGYVLIMTTNYKDRLDPALIQPGRVDYSIEFNAAIPSQAKGIFKNMFTGHPPKELESLAERFSEKLGEGRTPADIQNYLQGYDSPNEACDPTSEKAKKWLLGSDTAVFTKEPTEGDCRDLGNKSLGDNMLDEE